MSEYRPDRWLVVKIVTATERLYKVFATWSGGYGGSDSWKMNSGITQACLVNGFWEFKGYSGSVYSCSQGSYGTNGYGGSVLQNFIDQMPTQGATMEIMPEATDWAELDYDPLQQWINSGIDKENTE
jgi:hypothetical protein